MKQKELLDFNVLLVHETEKAWLINEGTKEIWIPKSIGELVREDKIWILTIPDFVAKDKGLI